MKDIAEVKANIFAYIFKLSNSLQIYMDRELAEDLLTSKQFFLMIVIHSFGREYPTFKQAADVSGSSYQNIKQIALKLEKHGYLEIRDDEDDKRAKRLVLTQKCREYWEKRNMSDITSINALFKEFNDDELKNLHSYILKLIEGIKRIEKK